MKVWLVRDLEPTPIDDGQSRLLRAGMLSEALAQRGHETTWFTSSFNHYSRSQRAAGRFNPRSHLTIEVVKGRGYQKNIGFARLLHNAQFGRSFLTWARASEDRPDIIIADLPTTEAASAAVRFGLEVKIPTVVTVRDLWPDFFADFAPRWLRPFVRLGLRPLENQAQFACRHATSLIGISQGYLEWGQAKGGRDGHLDRIFYLGYPRPDPQSAPEPEKALSDFGIPPSAEVVTFVGSWGATYDLALLVEAARHLLDHQGIVMAIAGDWTVRPDLALAFRELPNVRLLGWLDKHQMAALLTRSAVGLLPYSARAPQGLPNKIFEYMAYGLFQIATLAGEAKGLLEMTATGSYSPAGSAAEFASAIKYAVAHQAGKDKRVLRQAVFAERFEAGHIYGSLIDHLATVVDEHRLDQRF